MQADDSKSMFKRQSQRNNDTNGTQAIPQQAQSTTHERESTKLGDGHSSSDDSHRAREENEINTPSTMSDVEVPANVDEVAMLNNVINIAKERKQHGQDGDTSGASKDLSEDEQLAKDVQEKYSLSEDKFRKLLKNAERMIHPDEKSRSHPDPWSLRGSDKLGTAETDTANEAGESETEQKPKMWRVKNNLRGHLDSVRSVGLHADTMLIASASDDGTVKLWDLKHSIGKDARGQKKTTHEDTDPLITFRGHTLGVTKVEVSAEQGRVYSSSLDSTIRIWKLPPLDRTPYAPVGTLSTFTVDMSEDTV
ncbi:1,2-dihydroxy-3-keto-5-methylthiopentene dioxygenase [Umbelopsis sp. WA50703]